MLRESLDLLALAPGSAVADGTVGAGGFAEAALERILPGGRLLAVDRDPGMIERARERLGRFGDATRFEVGNFSELPEHLRSAGMGPVDAIFLDFGFASDQLDDPARGLSFSREGPLDMRLDPTGGRTALEWLETASEEDIVRALFEYGEEPHARRIARAIAEARARGRLPATTTAFAGFVARASGWGRGRRHPATRTFQAVRIAVNDELGSIERGLPAALGSLAPGGRLAAISFHSLEDRIVKHVLREAAARGAVELLTRKPVRPSFEEIARNPRSRSAKLRAARATEARS